MPIVREEFKRLLSKSVPRFSKYWLNERQDKAAFSDVSRPLFIVAGPGTGKTTVLAVRILYYIFVEGYAPESIIATTFTRKAANELRSRVLSWGNALQSSVLEEYKGKPEILQWVRRIDINLIITGTLDSIAQEVVENDRQPTEITPVVIEAPLSKGLLRKNIIFPNAYQNNEELKKAIATIEGKSASSINTHQMINSIIKLSDRMIQDLVDLKKFEESSDYNRVLMEVIQQYWGYLQEKHYMDFALLEKEFLLRIKQPDRISYLQSIRAIFVDEFQDTNPLQEEIYYSLCDRFNVSLTVVGDDDQSIYRFRGATVEIFSRFAERIVNRLGSIWQPERVNLVTNYRSSERIVSFSNAFLQLDTDYQLARTPGKELIEPFTITSENNLPVLGMFRNTIDDLAKDLSTFLFDIFEGDGYSIKTGGDGAPKQIITILKGTSGNWGDSVLLARTANDFGATDYLHSRPRFPYLIRRNLEEKGVQVFNPRGKSLTDIEDVRHILGLILLCIDSNGQILSNYLSTHTWANTAVQTMNSWKVDAQQYITKLSPNDSKDLQAFIADWADQKSPDGQEWPSQWPLVELLFTLMRWIPAFQDNPEGQIYLEVLARAITTGGKLSAFSGNILFSPAYHDSSVRDIFQEVMLPLANGEIDVDEEIMPNVPRNYFPIMTIHQSKGLEFPLVIVDIGSDFKTNHYTQRGFRYPERGGEVHLIENAFSNYSEIGDLRTQRTEIQRAFDDLRRQYFVANTRPQNILLLVGLMSVIQNNNLKAVQAGSSSQDSIRHINFKHSLEWNEPEAGESVLLI